MSTIQADVTICRASGMSDDELDELTRKVLMELRELDLGKAELAVSGRAPSGSKSPEMVVIVGSLIIAVLPHALPKLLEVLGNIVTRRRPTIEANIKFPDGREASVKFTPGSTSQKEIAEVLTLLDRSVDANRILK